MVVQTRGVYELLLYKTAVFFIKNAIFRLYGRSVFMESTWDSGGSGGLDFEAILAQFQPVFTYVYPFLPTVYKFLPTFAHCLQSRGLELPTFNNSYPLLPTVYEIRGLELPTFNNFYPLLPTV